MKIGRFQGLSMMAAAMALVATEAMPVDRPPARRFGRSHKPKRKTKPDRSKKQFLLKGVRP